MEELLRASLNENLDWQYAIDTNLKYYSLDEGKHIEGMIRYLNDATTQLCDLFDETCCSRKKNKHFDF
jgi:hypothetical protein